MPETKILTTAELSKVLKLAPITIQRAAARGEIPGRKVAGQWRFDLAEVEEYLAQQATTPGTGVLPQLLRALEAIRTELRGVRADLKKLKGGSK